MTLIRRMFLLMWYFLCSTKSELLSFHRLLSIDESAVYKVPTIKKLRALFDNYELDSSAAENVTTSETSEENEFINAVLDTQVMQTAMGFLNKKGLLAQQISVH